MSTSSRTDYSVKPTFQREVGERMTRKHKMDASAELSFRDRAASIRWVADRMSESERVAELRAYADELDHMADTEAQHMFRISPENLGAWEAYHRP